MASWWHKRSLTEQIAILGLVVAVIGSIIVPVYLDSRDGSGAAVSTSIPPSSSPSMTTGSTTPTDPVVFSIEENPAKIPTFNDFGEELVVPTGVTIVGGPGRACRDFHPWGTQLGGVPARVAYLRLVVQGQEARSIVLTGMRAKIVEREPPLQGTQLACPSAGEAEIRSIDIDLDEPSPEAQYKTPEGTKPFGFTIAKNETEIFDIRVTTEKCYCSWFLELELIIDGHKRVHTIGSQGDPFRTTASTASLVYSWDYQNTWYLTDADGSGNTYEPQPRDQPLKPLN
jgi:hypothetical protein